MEYKIHNKFENVEYEIKKPISFSENKNCCQICGRITNRLTNLYGYKKVCSKHMHQILKYGHPIDNNPRTEQDLNGFRFLKGGSIVEFDCYDINQNVVAHFYIDTIDLERVRYKKWRLSTHNRIVSGNCTNKNPRTDLSRFILGTTDPNIVVDHIDGNPLNNTRSNLRECTVSENMMNRHFMSNNTSGAIGVVWDKYRGRWAPEITISRNKIHLGRYKDIEEAKFVRYIAEQICFGKYQCYKDQNFDHIVKERQQELYNYVFNKISEKLRQSAM